MRVLAATLLALLLTAAVASAHTQSGPTLRLARSTNSLVIHGHGFRAREGVRVTVTTTRSRAKVLRTTAFGTFTAYFAATGSDRCSALVIRALGTRGDHALLKSPAPECPPE